jgi:glycosyltransferase involved in cell wall biosynthesis
LLVTSSGRWENPDSRGNHAIAFLTITADPGTTLRQDQAALQFSIITVVWNRAGTLGDALASLSAQTHTTYEHILQDGGSTDGTLAVLEASPDPRRKVVSERDAGIYDALNRGLARASGDVIGLLHSDDMLAHPDVLARVAQRFAETGADAVYGDLDYVSAQNTDRVIRHWRSGEYHPARLREGWMPPHPTLFLKRHVIERHGGYDTSFRIAADYDTVLRYFGKGEISAAYVPEVLVKMRVGGESNRSLGRILRKSREDHRALKKNGIGGFGTLARKNLSKLHQFIVKS